VEGKGQKRLQFETKKREKKMAEPRVSQMTAFGHCPVNITLKEGKGKHLRYQNAAHCSIRGGGIRAEKNVYIFGCTSTARLISKRQQKGGILNKTGKTSDCSRGSQRKSEVITSCSNQGKKRARPSERYGNTQRQENSRKENSKSC